MVRCKFKCIDRHEFDAGGWHLNVPREKMYSFHFQVVYGDSPENKDFYNSTPGGYLMISSVKNDLFVPGQEYYLDFTNASSGD